MTYAWKHICSSGGAACSGGFPIARVDRTGSHERPRTTRLPARPTNTHLDPSSSDGGADHGPLRGLASGDAVQLGIPAVSARIGGGSPHIPVAQLAEFRDPNSGVAGSTPAGDAISSDRGRLESRLALEGACRSRFDSGRSGPFAAGEAHLSDSIRELRHLPHRLSGCTKTIDLFVKDLDRLILGMDDRASNDARSIARIRNQLVLLLSVDGIILSGSRREPLEIRR